jgi:membrane associated rhomboid family serine protease
MADALNINIQFSTWLATNHQPWSDYFSRVFNYHNKKMFFGMPRNAQPQGGQPGGGRPNIVQMCSDWLAQLPVVTIFVVFVCFICYLWSTFSKHLNDYALCPYKIIEFHQYYRWITSPFLHLSFGHIFMNMLTMACLGGKVERGMGSLAFLGLNAALVLTTCLLETGLSWVIFKILPSEFYPLYYLTYTVGYSGVLFGLIVVDCANSPAVDRVLCCCPVPAWLYPWVLFFAIQFAMGPLVSWIGHLSGIGCGYLYAKGLLNWCTLPMASLRTFENRPCLSGLVSYSRWARVPDASYIAGCQLPYTASWEGACCRGLDAQACRGLCSCCPSASALRSSVPPLQLPGSGRSLGGNRYHQVTTTSLQKPRTTPQTHVYS